MVAFELSSTSSSDEEDNPDLSIDSEEVFKKSELKRIRLQDFNRKHHHCRAIRL